MPTLTGESEETLAFLHIQKTAGRTVQQILLNLCRARGASDFGFPGSIAKFAEFAAMPAVQRSSYDLLRGHCQYGIHHLVNRPVRYFTFLRDPADRVVSLYAFVRENNKHVLHDRVVGGHVTLAQFAAGEYLRTAENGIVRSLIERLIWNSWFGDLTSDDLEEATQNLFERIEVFGLMERFDESLLLIADAFGWDDQQLPYIRRNVTRDRPQLEDLDEDTRQAINDATEFDRQLYLRAQAEFDRRISQKPSSFHDRLAAFRSGNPGSRAEFDNRGHRVDGLSVVESRTFDARSEQQG